MRVGSREVIKKYFSVETIRVRPTTWIVKYEKCIGSIEVEEEGGGGGEAKSINVFTLAGHNIASFYYNR